MTRLLLIAAALVLAGCATNKPPERVLVPVPVPCKVDVPREPVWATDSLSPDADIWDQTKALLAERAQRIGYQKQLKAAIDACQPGSAPDVSTLDGRLAGRA